MPRIITREPTRKEYGPEHSTKLTPGFARQSEDAKKYVLDKVARQQGRRRTFGGHDIPQSRWDAIFGKR